jgi:hypothetical protein
MPKQPPSYDGDIHPAYDICAQLEAAATPWPFPSPEEELVARWGTRAAPHGDRSELAAVAIAPAAPYAVPRPPRPPRPRPPRRSPR